MSQKKSILNEHFERLKELVPEVYAEQISHREEPESHKLFFMLKKALGIIEAVYLQNREMFHQKGAEEYSKIINELKTLGYEYQGNEELLEKAAGKLLMSAKKPMVKAKGARKEASSSERRAM